ncbi:MAG: YdeI/OmpD-associated family protein [Solirubrobacteraceae bacterium]|nr:YdeI/OmpD-associated family protein [Solirubrobacteraceae bacterium]
MSDAPAPVTITATLEPRGPAAAIVLTDEQVAEIGQGAKTPAVTVTVNGDYTFAGRIGRMKGETLLGFNKAVREAAGVEAGQTITVEVTLETAPREVELPDDLKAGLEAEPGALDAFAALAPSHRKEYVRWVTEAKREETRAKRVAEAVPMIAAGKPRR